MMNNVDETRRLRRLRELEFRRQIDSNDPSLLRAEIGSYTVEYSYIPHDGDWGKLGASIGRNTFIEEVRIEVYRVDLSSFARGFALNRSIKSLTICCGQTNFHGEFLGELLPFFMNNPAFTSLRVEYAEPTCLHELASVLRQFDTLTEFALKDCEDHDDDHFDENDELYDEYNDSEAFSAAVTEVFQALAGHSSLTKLSIEQSVADGWQYRKILSNGWESLTALLCKSSSNLMVLELEDTPMDNVGAYILAAGILVNASLKEFSLHCTHIMTKDGLDAIFAVLKRSTCTLEMLSVCMNLMMEDDVLSSISNALFENCTLKSLCLDGYGIYAPSATVANRGALFQLLLNPVCALEILNLNSVGLNNDSIMCLRNALANNSRLRELRLGRNHDVTTDGWVNFLTFPSNAKLEKLVLGYRSDINDEALDVFRMSLTNNRTLKDLHLDYFPNVTTAGWTAFSTVLCSPNFFLEKLDVTPTTWGDSDIIDFVTSFADALTNNKRLRELRFFCNIETEICAPLTRIVCNNSSIMSTYNSNHILSKVSQECYWKLPLPFDLACALQINRENSVSQAARLKNIKSHFSGSNINTRPFTVMELRVLPTAISWMGQDCGFSEISDLLFAFVRSMPLLCDTKNRCKKRKSVI
jgi:hypothetical protein